MSDSVPSPGTRVHGFETLRVVPLGELNATLVELRHQVTGARYLHFRCADDNNLFAVGFRTPPRDSTGAPHILEHTVLCGSERYPVRDPFFSMLKRSLSTFMNALTAEDWTLYPYASQNRTDFYNLMGVYLDAAFFPLLRERDFRQEGHRLEFAEPADPASPLVVKGVVYNEMKGHMSDPHSLLATRLSEALYPTSPYGKNAGGWPAHIPELTWEELRAFHATCYHPSNAYFFSYGDLPLEPHLEYVQREVLQRFERRAVDTEVPAEQRFREPRRLAMGYPLDPGEATTGKTMVQLAWLTCPISDDRTRLGLELLSELLLGNPAAPLHKALLDSKLGANLAPGTGYQDENRDTYFAAGLQGTEPERAAEIEALVLRTLEESARRGFPRERVDAAIQQLEFEHREVRGDHYPYALSLLSRMMGPWIHGADPVRSLTLGARLSELRSELERGDYFGRLIREQLLDNPHRVTLVLQPDPDLREREARDEARRLAELREGLPQAEAQRIVAEAEQLRLAQEARDDVSVLPTLELADIPPEERRVSWERAEEAGVPLCWFDQPTNGIGYLQAHLTTAGLPEELGAYLPLFCAVLPLIGAAGHSYEQMAERIAAATGGIQAGLTLLESPTDPTAFQTFATLQGKALERYQGQMFEILSDLLGAPDFADRARLHTVFNQLRVNLDNSLVGMGHRYAARVAAAQLSPAARLRERWAGVEHIRFVRQVASRGVEELGEVAEMLACLAGVLLRRERARCAVTGEARLFPSVRRPLTPFLNTLKNGGAPPAVPSGDAVFAASPGRKGLIASVPVAYVTRVFPAVPLVHPDSAGLLVLAKLLKSGYLHREIREKGGAYGGMAGHSAEAGLFSLLSYRDPHVARTLRVFDDAARWAAGGAFADDEIREAILGVFGDLDRPLSPSGRGAREYASLLQGLTWEMRQELRGRILAVTRRDLCRLAETYLVAGRGRSAVAVLGGEEALRAANRELGAEALELERI